MSEIRYLTVTALTKYIKKKFDVDPHMQKVFLKGEISNFKQHSRGHMYFTIKDENARIQSVMFSANNRSIKFKPEDGMKVLIQGEISVYEPNGNYQLYVTDMQPDGIGSLFLAYEELKKRLELEGLFSAVHKKAIPKYPERIGVITSPTGAAVRDIIITIKRRYPIGEIIILPTLVQGDQAAPSIVKSIKKANDFADLDVLIVGRGGGSIEELWAFNEESVARAIFESRIPIISAVGHETDFTIADFVADLRAPTPTGAAELAVPHIDELVERINQRRARLIRAMKEKSNSERKRLVNLQRSYAFRYPKQLYSQKEQQLDRLLESLQRVSNRYIEQKKYQLEKISSNLSKHQPSSQIQLQKERHLRVSREIHKLMAMTLGNKEQQFSYILSKLEGLSPLRIMDRGYSIVYSDDQENIIKSTKQVTPGNQISVRLKDGILNCEINGIEREQENE
ncbi:exodeoxyribonuclease VII large subunit [Bacillus mesophilus]|uniref:Exodeoxyribonuclease 7 large subunit n=1 Tax=Bacillus mesophilus TaxID=1808955 RepID=A0A6M0Q596_9BACI|nr:exodeoxyribonuclease VII large subunit [Bacillus mesophilus]MBM7660898.1 exodeoxyribonuclease VII large subunit [Bacillus mesophilus]NEY71556.1 exodeoxyribonuclease VII large subunit [Bacillus mesophilus]